MDETARRFLSALPKLYFYLPALRRQEATLWLCALLIDDDPTKKTKTCQQGDLQWLFCRWWHDIKKGTFTKLLNEMETAGLLKRSINQTNRSENLVQLTKKGQRSLNNIMRRSAANLTLVLNKLRNSSSDPVAQPDRFFVIANAAWAALKQEIEQEKNQPKKNGCSRS